MLDEHEGAGLSLLRLGCNTPGLFPTSATHATPRVLGFRCRSLQEMSRFNRQLAKTHSGVWRDLAVRKRRTEAEHQLGPIVSHGQHLGVPTPMTTRLIELIHEIENGIRPQDIVNLDALKALI